MDNSGERGKGEDKGLGVEKYYVKVVQSAPAKAPEKEVLEEVQGKWSASF